MNVSLIKIENVLGIESLEFRPTPNGVTVIRGRNGTGKTSIVEAIKGILKRGNDATLLRKGAEHGEAVIVLEHNGFTYEIRREFHAEGQDLIVERDGQAIKKPQTSVDELFPDQLVLDPRAFITGTPQYRIEKLLELADIHVTEDEMKTSTHGILGLPASGRSDLAVLDAATEKLELERRRLKAQLDEKEKTAAGIRKELPEEVLAVTLEQKKTAKEKVDAAKGDFDVRRQKIRKALVDEFGRVDADHAKRLMEAKDVYDAEVAAARKERDGLRELAQKEADAATAKLEAVHQPQISDAERELTQVEERLREADRARALAKTAADIEKSAAIVKVDWQALDSAVKGIRQLRLTKLAAIPMKGVTIEDDMYLDGIAFPRLNTAKKVQVVMTLVKQRAQRTGNNFIILDGMELLDDDMFRAMEDYCERYELQVCATRVVAKEGLTIETREGVIKVNADN